MPIYKPSELQLFLNSLNIFPKKRLSQNFLIDGNIIDKIIRSADVQPGDLVLEIGPGPGSLTEALLNAGASVIAIEKDETLAKALERLQTSEKTLSVFCQDILEFPLEEAIKQRAHKGKKAKVIANLPYHLTTPIIARLSPLSWLFSSLTLMVQEEVARRMTALPNSQDYSSLSLFLRFYSTPSYAFKVSRHCFFPSPNVDSAIVSIALHPPPLEEPKTFSFFQMTRKAFEQRRKMLRVSLKPLFAPSEVEKALKQIGQSALARPENLSLNDFLALYALCAKI